MRLSCALLVFCTCANAVSIKHSVRSGLKQPNPQILVLFVELSKLIISAIFLFGEKRFGIVGENTCLDAVSVSNFFLFAVPGILYTFCNNVPYIILRKMELGTYVMLSTIKIPTTATLMWLMLGKRLSRTQLYGVLLLGVGTVISLLDFHDGIALAGPTHAYLLTFLSALLSAFAAVWSEYMLKSSPQSINLQNMQLYFHSTLANMFFIGLTHGANFFAGFSSGLPDIADVGAWSSVVTLTGVGLLTSLVMKYADNILKLFLSGASMCVSRLLACVLFGDTFTTSHAIGLALVLFASYIY
ncbi:Drug/Metabolite transporter superfamily, partial [Micromonas commoda]